LFQIGDNMSTPLNVLKLTGSDERIERLVVDSGVPTLHQQQHLVHESRTQVTNQSLCQQVPLPVAAKTNIPKGDYNLLCIIFTALSGVCQTLR